MKNNQYVWHENTFEKVLSQVLLKIYLICDCLWSRHILRPNSNQNVLPKMAAAMVRQHSGQRFRSGRFRGNDICSLMHRLILNLCIRLFQPVYFLCIFQVDMEVEKKMFSWILPKVSRSSSISLYTKNLCSVFMYIYMLITC